MTLQEEFEQAVKKSKEITKRPSNEDLLKIYALYKQATEGDVHGKRPSGFDFKGAAKYNAWESFKGKGGEEVKTAYIALIEKLINA